MKKINLQKINSLILGNDLSGSVLLKSMLAEQGVKTKFCHTTGRKLDEAIAECQPNIVLLCLFDAAVSFTKELMDKSVNVLGYEPVFILVEESHASHVIPLSDRDYEGHLVIKSSLSKHDIYNALFRAVGYWGPQKDSESTEEVTESAAEDIKNRTSEGV